MDINLVGPIGNLGYGVATFNILKQLMALGHNVSLFPIGEAHFQGDEEAKRLIDTATQRATHFNPNAPSVRVWHQHDMSLFPGKGLRVGWPIFELDKFTEREIHHLNSLDAIIVCSAWAKRIIEANGITPPCYVVPLGVDTSVFYPTDEIKKPYWAQQQTIFINAGKWEKRKGHEELLEAFNKAFEPGDHVQLWMINDNPFIGHQNDVWRRRYADSKMGAHVRLFPRVESQHHLRIIFNHADCGVFPAHAEGFNLEPLEMLACGRRVIATDYSGHTEYLNEVNSYLLQPTGMELARDDIWFHGQGSWATFSVDDLAIMMKTFHNFKQSNLPKLNMAGLATAAEFSWENSCGKLLKVLAN